jgi:hypothetical protein
MSVNGVIQVSDMVYKQLLGSQATISILKGSALPCLVRDHWKSSKKKKNLLLFLRLLFPFRWHRWSISAVIGHISTASKMPLCLCFYFFIFSLARPSGPCSLHIFTLSPTSDCSMLFTADRSTDLKLVVNSSIFCCQINKQRFSKK